MPHRHWRATLLALVTAFTLAGCAGNYKFDDDSYRPWEIPRPSTVTTEHKEP